MKKSLLIVFFALFGTLLVAQEKMYIHLSNRITLGALVAETDSVYFSEDLTTAFFRIGDTLAPILLSQIDSISFGANSNTIEILYTGTEVSILNPLAFEGVEVAAEGADVTVHSFTETQDINIRLSGTTLNGSFKIYSAKRYNLILNGVDLTNPDGPAINIQSTKKTTLILQEGTTSTLTDGPVYADPPAGEEQDGTVFSEGKLVFSGTGTLTINGHGSEEHSVCSDDEIELTGGTIQISSDSNDGIHANDGILLTGGTVGITVAGDQSKGMQCDTAIWLNGGALTIHNSGDAALVASGSGYEPAYCTAIKASDTISIAGAEITITASGKAGRGISSDKAIIMTSGNIHVTSTGNGATYVNSTGTMDAYVSTCLNSDGRMILSGGTVTTSSSGSGGKGFSSNGAMIIGSELSAATVQVTTTGTRIHISGSGGNARYAEAKAIRCDSAITVTNVNLTIASSDDALKSETAIEIHSGNIIVTNSVEGIEAPFITVNDGTIRVTASDDCINSTFGIDGEFDDGSLLTINGGYLVINALAGDGFDCNGDLLITGGTTIIHGPPSQPEVGMDYNGSCNVDGGFLVISGNNSFMTQAPSNSSDQYSLKVMSNQVLSSSTLFHIQDAAANNILTFQPARNYYSIIFSSSELQNGSSYSIYTGGTCTGTNMDGLYSGGTYTGGIFRKTFTISSKITNVNF